MGNIAITSNALGKRGLPPLFSVGVVGLGLIGTSLARRLMSAGFTVHGYDIDDARRARLASLGGQPAASLRDVGKNCQTVILAVFNTDQVESVVEGRGGQPLPLATVYIDLIEACLAHGDADLDNSAIIKEFKRRRLKCIPES